MEEERNLSQKLDISGSLRKKKNTKKKKEGWEKEK